MEVMGIERVTARTTGEESVQASEGSLSPSCHSLKHRSVQSSVMKTLGVRVRQLWVQIITGIFDCGQAVFSC